MSGRFTRGRWVEDGRRDDSLVEQMRKGRDMTEPLTHGEMTELHSFANAFLPSRAWQLLDRLVEELRERRAADLTIDELALVRKMRALAFDSSMIALLDRLLARGREG